MKENRKLSVIGDFVYFFLSRKYTHSQTHTYILCTVSMEVRLSLLHLKAISGLRFVEQFLIEFFLFVVISALHFCFIGIIFRNGDGKRCKKA